MSEKSVYTRSARRGLRRFFILLPVTDEERELAAQAALQQFQNQFEGGTVVSTRTMLPLAHGWYRDRNKTSVFDNHVMVILDKDMDLPDGTSVNQPARVVRETLGLISATIESCYPPPINELRFDIVDTEAYVYFLRSEKSTEDDESKPEGLATKTSAQ